MPATGPELATAYVSISASTKGLGKDIAKAMGAPEIGKAGESAGRSISSRIGGVMKKSAIGTGLVVGGLLGGAITKGFKRLNAIDQAQAKLRGLGHTSKDVSRIMGNALASVKGTAFGLDEAATTAGAVVAAGIKPGKQLEGVLKTVADTATIAGTSMSDMGTIFGSVAARGKLQGDDMLQLTSRGVPVLKFLADHYGITAKKASEMVTSGKVDFKNFAEAMHENIGGAALDSGKTVQGAWKNLGASISRIGANLLSGVFPKLQKGFVGLTKWLGPVEDKAKVVGQALGKWLGRAADAAQGLFDLFIKGDFTHAFYKAFHVSDDSDLVANLFAVRDAAIKSFGYLKDKILPVVVSGFKGLWDAAQPIIPALLKVGRSLLGIFKGAGTSAKDSGPGILAAAFALLRGAIKGIAAVLGWVGDFATNHQTTFQALAVGVLAIVGAMKAWTVATRIWQGVTKAAAVVQGAFNAVMALNPISVVILALVGLAAGLVYAYKKSETFRRVVDAVWAGLKAGAGLVVSWFTDRFIPFFTKTIPSAFRATLGWARAHWPLILGILTGPIGLAVGLIIKHRDRIMAALLGAWTWAKGTFASLWGGLKLIILTPLRSARDNVAAILADLRRKFRTAVDRVGSIWGDLKRLAMAPIRFVVDTVLNKGLLGTFNKIAGFFGKKSNLHVSAGFAQGGWTGPGGKYQPAGVVHADEFVVQKSSQRDLARNAPGFLDALNQHGSKALGYFGGGLVGKLRDLSGLLMPGNTKAYAKAGITLSQVPAMLRDAVGELMSGVGSGPVAGILKAIPGRLISAAVAAVKKITGSDGPHVTGDYRALEALVRPLGAVITSAVRPGARTTFGNLSRHALGKAIDIAPDHAIWEKLYAERGRFYELLGPWGMFLRGKPYYDPTVAAMHKNHIHLSSYADGGTVRPKVYDQGGILPPGLHTVYNGTGKGERVRTAEQEAALSQFPRELTLVVDGHRFSAYVDTRADHRIERQGRRAVGGRNF